MLCVQYDELHIIYLSLLFLNLVYCLELSSKLSATIISTASAIIFVISRNVHFLGSYYLYDLVLSIYNLDFVMIAHHGVSIYALAQCPGSSDFDISMRIIWFVKFSDMLLHIPKILDMLETNIRYPCITRLTQLFCMIVTLFIWIIVRYCIILFISTEIKEIQNKIVLNLFLGICLAWLIKMPQKIVHYANLLIEHK